MKKQFILPIVTLFVLLSVPKQPSSATVLRRHHVTGTVITRDRKPVPSLLVIVRQDDRILGKSITGDDGRYYIGRLKNGTYTLIIKRRDDIVYRAEIRLPEDRVHDVELDPFILDENGITQPTHPESG